MIQHIPLEQIIPNPEQPRKHFEPEALAGLAQSVQRKLIQPIVVEEVQAGLYMLHDGERRWRAAKLAGLATIEAVVRPSLNGTGQQERLLDALIANVQRVDLDPIEEAQSLGSLRATGLSINQIADKTGMAYVTVSGRLRLLDLDTEIQELIAYGQLPRDRRVADALLSIEDREKRLKLASRLARPGITIPTIINACAKLKESLAQERQLQIQQTPALALAGGNVPAQGTAKWRDVRAAAQAVGLSAPDVARLCGIEMKRVHFRYVALGKKERIAGLIQGEQMVYDPEKGQMFADWRLHRERFPRLVRAVERFRAGRMNRDDVRLVMGVLACWAGWWAQTSEQRERAKQLALLTVRTRQGLERVYREIRAWGIDPLAGEGADK